MLFTIHITPVCGNVAMILLLELSLSPYLSCDFWDNQCTVETIFLVVFALFRYSNGFAAFDEQFSSTSSLLARHHGCC
jgi:hypothetical protein